MRDDGAGRCRHPGYDLHLPHAPADPPQRARGLSALRHGARASSAGAAERAEPRAARHDAPILDRRRARACRCFCSRWARTSRWRVRSGSSHPSRLMWVQFALGTPVVLWAGWPLLTRGWASVRHRSLNMFSLISLGVGASYLYSLAATFAPGLFPASLRGEGGLVPVYYEAAAADHGTRAARPGTGAASPRDDRQRDPRPAQSRAQRRPAHPADGTDEEVPLDAGAGDDRLRVRPGEAVPVDGVGTRGHERRR